MPRRRKLVKHAEEEEKISKKMPKRKRKLVKNAEEEEKISKECQGGREN